MSEKFRILVSEIIGGYSAISTDDGNTLNKRLKQVLKDDRVAEVDFKDIKLILSSFLNASFGQLIGDFSKDFIHKNIEVKNLSADDVELLNLVLDSAETYFSNQKEYKKAIDEVD